jgi:hypothetical protein
VLVTKIVDVAAAEEQVRIVRLELQRGVHMLPRVLQLAESNLDQSETRESRNVFGLLLER